jgi:hypothetical protein
MTQLDLFSILREILADECGCKACWGEHPHPLSADELGGGSVTHSSNPQRSLATRCVKCESIPSNRCVGLIACVSQPPPPSQIVSARFPWEKLSHPHRQASRNSL